MFLYEAVMTVNVNASILISLIYIVFNIHPSYIRMKLFFISLTLYTRERWDLLILR